MTGQRTGRYGAPPLQSAPFNQDALGGRVAPSTRTRTEEGRSVPVSRDRRRGPRHQRVETPTRGAPRAPQRRWNPGCRPWALAHLIGRRRAHRIAEARPQPIREITFISPTARPLAEPESRGWRAQQRRPRGMRECESCGPPRVVAGARRLDHTLWITPPS